MKKIYRYTETLFEKIVTVSIAILGNSITFIIALLIVIFWLSNTLSYSQNIHDRIRDLILSITFLTLFIIQKAFNRFSALLHLKVNELVASHEPASNTVMHAGEKTEHEIKELSKGYSELALFANGSSRKKALKSELKKT
jgi:low affinity Fe/Cu permease